MLSVIPNDISFSLSHTPAVITGYILSLYQCSCQNFEVYTITIIITIITILLMSHLQFILDHHFYTCLLVVLL